MKDWETRARKRYINIGSKKSEEQHPSKVTGMLPFYLSLRNSSKRSSPAISDSIDTA